MIQRGMFQTPIDLTDAFLTVPVKVEHHPYLKFIFQGQIFQYLVLPFGYTGSPRIFSKIIGNIVARLRSLGLLMSFYLDDSWQGAPSFKGCLDACVRTYSLLQACGFIPKLSKSTLLPSTCIDILGTRVDSVSVTVTLPPKKSEKILSLIQHHLLCKSRFISIRDLASLIGKLLSCTIVCPLGQLYYRDMEWCKLRGLKLNNGNWDGKCKLTDKALIELQWWSRNLPHSFAPIHRPNPHLVLYTDSSSYAWGGFFQGQYCQGYFTDAEKQLSINTKETLAILYSYCSFKEFFHHNPVLVQSDSTCAITYVKNFGGMPSALRSKIVKDLWECVVDNDSWLSISHISGVSNREADWASRFLSVRMEWHLAPSIFADYVPISQLIRRLIYLHHGLTISYHAITALVQMHTPNTSTLSRLLGMSICTMLTVRFNLLHRTLEKLKRDRTRALMIFPAWPRQAFFGTILTMLVTHPVILPSVARSRCTLTLPFNSNIQHPNFKNLKLLSAVLSGIPEEVVDFQSTLSSCCYKDLLNQHNIPILPRSNSGICFVTGGKLIHCCPLYPN